MKDIPVIRSVVIFEDHSLENFRPLALSVPTYEIRMGMFNLRERVELAGKNLCNQDKKGTLLCRNSLGSLHTCEGWDINPEGCLQELDSQNRYLWLNGRCLPKFSEIIELLEGASGESGFICVDDHGLVAADLSPEQSQTMLASWNLWKEQYSTITPDQAPWRGVENLPKLPLQERRVQGLGYIWDIVPATSELLAQDIDFLSNGRTYTRRPFGIFPGTDNTEAFWLKESSLVQGSTIPAIHKQFPDNSDDLWVGSDVKLSVGTALDTTNGPIILDHGVTVMPHCYLEGPLYVGPGSRIKAGATIYGESSFGIGNRLAGEIGESTFSDFANKQHDGFIGHAVLGSWINLGAMTTNSDLKNNYGNVRVDLGSGVVDTGLRFVGLLLGDHAKTAIGTLFNTGTCVGFASNIFGGVMPPKFVANFSWGGLPENPLYDVDKAMATAEVVMSRRGCRLSEAGKKLMRELAEK